MPAILSTRNLVDFIQDLTTKIDKAFEKSKSVTTDIKAEIRACAEAISVAAGKIADAPAIDLDATITTGDAPPTPPIDITALTKAVTDAVTANMKTEMTALKKALADNMSSTSAATTKSYADALANCRQATAKAGRPAVKTPANKPAIIVSSTSADASAKEVVETWQKKISFTDTNFAPTRIQPVSKGKVRIEFASKDHCEIAKKKAAAVTSLKVGDAKRLKPLLVLKGISKHTEADDVITILKQQNAGLTAAKMTKCFKRFNYNDKLYNLVIEVDGVTRQQILVIGRLNLNHQRVHVADYCQFKQCAKCLRFGHLKNKCTAGETACAHCMSTEHQVADCPAKGDGTPRCHQCHRHNVDYNKSTNDAHSALSTKCPIVQAMIQRTNERVDYAY